MTLGALTRSSSVAQLKAVRQDRWQALPCSHNLYWATSVDLGFPDLALGNYQGSLVPQRRLGQRVLAFPHELVARFGIVLAVPVRVRQDCDCLVASLEGPCYT